MGLLARKGSAWPMRAATLTPHEFDAAIFDMDSVITQTATLHARAWVLKQLLQAIANPVLLVQSEPRMPSRLKVGEEIE